MQIQMAGGSPQEPTPWSKSKGPGTFACFNGFSTSDLTPSCQAEEENAEDEIREAFQVFDGVSTRLTYQPTLVGTTSVMAQTVFYSFVRMIGLTNCIS